MKLIDILKELNKPEKIYQDSNKEITMADLSPEEKEELFAKGSILVKLPTDPNRPNITSASKVISLPKMDQIKREIIKNKQEFDVFTFSSDEDIKTIAKEINSLYNKLYRAMNALDKTIDLKKRGRI
jgi:DNA repair ATPase RecN